MRASQKDPDTPTGACLWLFVALAAVAMAAGILAGYWTCTKLAPHL
jgi:hypothetical protein